jgi:DNA polymerase I-like protein with 3'-5' exonuclease and polymerase domains
MVENQFFGGKVLAVNTIHDSYLFDLHLDMLEDFSKIVKESLENTPSDLYNLFNIKFELPLKVDLEHGPNWKECKIEVKV